MVQWLRSTLGSTVSKGVLIDDDGAETFLVGILIRVLVLLSVAELGHTNPNTKLLTAIRTLEDQSLTFLVLGFIKSNVMVAFRTSYSLHVSNMFWRVRTAYLFTS